MAEHINSYYNLEGIARSVAAGNHRQLVGGMWEEIGKLQFEFVRDHGLTPQMDMLDIGCGSLRGGVHFVEYLQPQRYFGIDISQALIDAGYEKELAPRGLDAKVSREHFACNFDFDASVFGKQFDIAIAQSLFTHLPLNHFKLCLNRIAPFMRSGSRLFATFFLCESAGEWPDAMKHEPGGIVTYPDKDPFHYQVEDLQHCIDRKNWQLEYAGPWQHPRDQQMVIIKRI